MNSITALLLFNLWLTLTVELGVAALLRVRGTDLLIIVSANCLTNPVVNIIFDWSLLLCGAGSAVPYLILAALEIAAVAGEALLYKKLLRFRRCGALRLSLILNAASFAAGELITLAVALLR